MLNSDATNGERSDSMDKVISEAAPGRTLGGDRCEWRYRDRKGDFLGLHQQ
jgi:phage-related protein